GRYVFNQAGREQLRRIARITIVFTGVAALAWAVGSALAPWVIRLIYGPELMPAVPLLRWQLGLAVLVWGDVAMSLCLLANKQTVLFVVKWLIALLAAFLASRIPAGFHLVPSPLHIPLTGYGLAVIFSFTYFARR